MVVAVPAALGYLLRLKLLPLSCLPLSCRFAAEVVVLFAILPANLKKVFFCYSSVVVLTAVVAES